MSIEEKRRFKRYDTNGLEGTLVFSVSAEVSNISLSGMAVEASTPFTVGQSYSVRLGSDDEGIHLTASTRWCELARVSPDDRGGQDTRYRSGFAFDDVLVGPGDKVRSFIESKVVIDVDERLTGRIEPPGHHAVSLETLSSISVLKLSFGGMLIETETPAPLESIHTIRLALGEGELMTQGRIASVVQPSVRNQRIRHRLGIEFLELSEDSSDILTQFIQLELETNPRDS